MDPSKDNKPGLMFVFENPEDVDRFCLEVKSHHKNVFKQ